MIKHLDLHVLYIGLLVFGLTSLIAATITIVPSEVRVWPVASFGLGVILFFTGPLILFKTIDRRCRRPLSGNPWRYLCINLVFALVLGLLTTVIVYVMHPQKQSDHGFSHGSHSSLLQNGDAGRPARL